MIHLSFKFAKVVKLKIEKERGGELIGRDVDRNGFPHT